MSPPHLQDQKLAGEQRRAQASRFTGDPLAGTIADNAANAGIVTGGRAMRPDHVDLRWAGATVMRNAEVEETGLGGWGVEPTGAGDSLAGQPVGDLWTAD